MQFKQKHRGLSVGINNGQSYLIVDGPGVDSYIKLPTGETNVVSDSPIDGKQYARKDGNWVEVETASISGINVSELADRANHTGTQSISTVVGLQTALDGKASTSIATTVADGLMSSSDKTKLDGIATGATANASDATLLSRANHTGEQSISTVTGLQIALDGKVDIGSFTPGLTWTTDVSGTLSNNIGYLVNVSGGPVTLTLPLSPSIGYTLSVIDIQKSSSNNNITISRNGEKIESLDEDLIIDINGAGIQLVYTGLSIGWKIVNEISSGSVYDPSYTTFTPPNINWSSGLTQSATITSNITPVFSGWVVGATHTFYVTSSGNDRTVTLPSTHIAPQAITNVVINTTVGFSCYFNGTQYIWSISSPGSVI